MHRFRYNQVLPLAGNDVIVLFPQGGAAGEYRRLNNDMRRETDKARKKWWEEQCDEIEDLQKQGKHAQAYSKIYQLQKRKCKAV